MSHMDDTNLFDSISHFTNRRNFITAAASSSSSLLVLPLGSTAVAAGGITTGNSLAEKLSKRDPSVLINSIFNVPP